MRPRRRGRGRRRGGGEDRDENGEMEASGSPGSGAERLRQPSSPARQPAAVAAESGVGSAGSCQPVTESGSGAVFFFFWPQVEWAWFPDGRDSAQIPSDPYMCSNEASPADKIQAIFLFFFLWNQ